MAESSPDLNSVGHEVAEDGSCGRVRGETPPQALRTKHAFRPTEMPSILQEISWSPSTNRMGLDLVPPFNT